MVGSCGVVLLDVDFEPCPACELELEALIPLRCTVEYSDEARVMVIN